MTYLRCDRCDVPLYDDPHWDDPELEPVCDGCCLSCRSTSSEPQITGGDSDSGSGGRDTAAAAQSVAGGAR